MGMLNNDFSTPTCRLVYKLSEKIWDFAYKKTGRLFYIYSGIRFYCSWYISMFENYTQLNKHDFFFPSHLKTRELSIKYLHWKIILKFEFSGIADWTVTFLVCVSLLPPLVRQRVIQIPLEKCSKRLASATEKERLSVELSPGGYGIHWPLIDEDLSINSLLSNNR